MEDRYFHHEADKSGTAYRIGKEAEQLFEDTMRHYMNVKLTTPEENKYNHTDIKISKDGEKWLSVDVKGYKSLLRDYKQQDELFWIEVVHDKFLPDGWMFADIDYIAFELQEGFAMVKPKRLQKLIKDKIGEEQYRIIRERRENKKPYFELRRRFTHMICPYMDDDGLIEREHYDTVLYKFYKRAVNGKDLSGILTLITKDDLLSITSKIIKKSIDN